ncbi:MAG: hybrid sensor histidine kinase/response regulator [Janthinobacterium lividum]
MTSTPSMHAFLSNGGAAGARIHAHDWTDHPLGPIAAWPAALRTALGMVLGSAFPTFLAWGEELHLFYNDAYEPVLGNKAVDALGRPLPQVWTEVWDAVGPYARRVLAGESFFFENFATRVERHGYPEQAFFTFSYSPVRDESGAACGVMCTVIEVTDKLRALARHKEAEERLALSLEASGNIGTWSYDLETAATHVDERFARLFQVDAALAREGTELARFTDMIHPEDRPAVLKAIDTAILTETLYDVEYRIPQRSGIDAWVNARGKVFADPDTGARRFAGIAVDITARKLAEQARIESERRADESARRLDVLLDAAPVGIVYADPGGRLLVANAYNRTIWGQHPTAAAIDDYAEWKGWWPAGSARAGEAVAAHEWPLAQVLAGRDSAGGVYEIAPFGAPADSPSARKTILVRAAAIRDEAGALVGAVAANMDISAQVAAERAMKDSEAKFRLIANAIPQMVWSAGASGVNDYLNSRWREFTGLPLERLAGDGWLALIHPDDLPLMRARWHDSFAGGAPFEVEHRMRHRSGAWRWMLNRAEASLDDAGRPTRWMGTLTDIHDKKSGEDELRAQARRKDEFLAMLAHELRNPLAPISNAAQLLSMTALDPQRVRQSSDVIIRQVRHMTSLVDDLLDVSRVTRGLVELERERVDVRAVVASAVEQARPLIDARRHTLALQTGPARSWVFGDRIRLVQVLVNLLNNAAKYTAQGGTISLSVEAHAANVEISVRDNGIGIDPAVLPHVFELFTQAERTPDRSQGGLGLGLALVQSLVQLHGGRVEAHSEGLGKGSCFSVTLPTIAAMPADAGAPPGPAAATPPSAAGGRRILVVDDNVDAALSLADVLRSLGHQVATAHTSHEALTLAQAGWPDVFILDIGLPDIDGYALARRLHGLADGRSATYLALTGYGQAHDRVLARSAGFDHHFVKPVELAPLVEVIERAPAAAA